MKKLSEYLKEQLPEVDLETCKNVIEKYRIFTHDQFGKVCNICLKELSIDEKINITNLDFQITCFEHKKYKNVFQMDLIRRELNINPVKLELYDL